MAGAASVTLKTSLLLIGITGLAVGPAFAQAPPPAGFPGKAPEGPPAEIVRFELEPNAIDPGHSTTLHWEALNAYSLSIEPGIGPVATRGSRALTPAQTTTYVLTVTGTGGTKTARATITVAGTRAASNTSSTTEAQAVPRLPTGEPDLSGVYLGGRDIHVVGSVAVKPGAEGYKVVRNPEDLGLGAQCLPPGVPGATLAPYPLQIVQKHDLVVILYEAYNIFRIIPLDRGHGEDLDPTWLGHSVGHWDGDTLVVDVVGFNDKTQLAGFHHTEALHVVERYRRKSFDKIEYTVSAEDPDVFAKPVEYAGELTLHPEWEIGEYICAENNKDYSELLEKPQQ